MTDERRTVPHLLHVLNGDSTRLSLERSGVPGTLLVWADVLHEGPAPGEDAGAEAFREARARHHDEPGFVGYGEALETLGERPGAHGNFRAYDELVMWFEHDLFDQLLLIQHLAWHATAEPGPPRLSLICIGEYPGFDDFMGLGQLAPDQLASLLETRAPITRRELDLGRAAWTAFTSPDPTRLERFLAGDTATLPFLGPALRRWLEELPGVTDGLSRTERRILRLLEHGPASATELFRANNREDRVFYLGDTSFGDVLRSLAAGEPAAITLEAHDPSNHILPAGLVRITDFGRALLAGTEDWVRAHGVDRWMGGVHLQGREVQWRWDGAVGRVRPS